MLHVTHKFSHIPPEAISIDTTAKAGLWSQLLPFTLPGGALYGKYHAVLHENAWQFAKLYPVHATPEGTPTAAYWRWAEAGWQDRIPHRYPMGKGARPLHSWWEGKPLGYITARKRIYAPLYARAVRVTEAYARLRSLLREESRDIYLRDWDGYDHLAKSLSITQVANDPNRKMGHAFVLWALLQNEYDALIHEDPVQLSLQARTDSGTAPISG